MFDETNGFHHVELHTRQPDKLLSLFIRTYDFRLTADRLTRNYSQWFLESNQCRLMISSVTNTDFTNEEKLDDDHYDILAAILSNDKTGAFIRDRNTVFNVALNVKSVQSILDRNSDLQVLVSCRKANDNHGSIEYACVKSCVGNVVHTLIDTSQYTGHCLPGFRSVSISKQHQSNASVVHGIDHVAFALPQNSALSTIAWYERVLGMKRFLTNQQDDLFQGFSVRVGAMGLRLFASEYWKCAETACVTAQIPTVKFVFSESLIDSNSNSTDQIKTFISQHNNQPGIQHMAFTCTTNIKEAVRFTRSNGAQFLKPCLDYYLKDSNSLAIEKAGEDPYEIAELGILLDTETDSADQSKSDQKVLLQIFTKSIFNNDTFFLELIERRGASGFGAGNTSIGALSFIPIDFPIKPIECISERKTSMATAIDDDSSRIRRPELLIKIDVEVNVNDAVLLRTEDGLVTALDDRTLRIWIRRQTGKYWPSVCYTLESAPTVIFYHEPSHRLFCGCDTGLLHEFLVADDLNKITLQCTYLGHQSRIHALYFSPQNELLLSTCREKKLNWYSTNPTDDNHQHPRGNYTLSSWALSLALDDLSRQCFVGDANGNVQFLRLTSDHKFQLITTLAGHTGSVQTLLWDPEAGWLFSGSFDSSVVVWDIGAHQGIALELNGHSDRVVGITFDKLRKLLITCAADGHVGVWPMNIKRNETPKWLEGDNCQICRLPFFWNVRAMWSQKQLGLRQHHCRKCGRAICDGCSQTRTVLPLIGYETVQRVCNDCVKSLKNNETAPLASFYHTRQGTIKTDYNQTKKILMTVGTDRTIKIWDLASIG